MTTFVVIDAIVFVDDCIPYPRVIYNGHKRSEAIYAIDKLLKSKYFGYVIDDREFNLSGRIYLRSNDGREYATIVIQTV